jgi:hypothetical protein
MNRRWWLKGAAGVTLMAGLGMGAAQAWKPGFEAGAWPEDLTPTLLALAAAVLRGTLPEPLPDPKAQSEELTHWTQRLQATLAGLPPAVQAEVSDLLGLLRLAPGRMILCGSGLDWAHLAPDDLHARLQAMRLSRLAPRQQAYHALRDLTHAAYYAGPNTWAALGYPGPPRI